MTWDTLTKGSRLILVNELLQFVRVTVKRVTQLIQTSLSKFYHPSYTTRGLMRLNRLWLPMVDHITCCPENFDVIIEEVKPTAHLLEISELLLQKTDTLCDV